MCGSCRNELSRRHLLSGAGALVAAATLRVPFACAEEALPQNLVSPDAALKRLMEGNERYVANAPQGRDYSAGRADLVKGQHPIAAILSCSDSRVSPELVFDQGPGDIFVVRLAGNFLDDDGLASLEYAVKYLGAPLLMVLGHTNCGAVAAAVKVVRERAELPGNLPELVKAIEPAVIAAHGRHPSDLVAAATEENVKLNVKRLGKEEPILSEALASKKVAAVGGIYDLATGKVQLL